MPHENWTPRQNVLTEADLQELSRLLAQHPCKFAVTHEEMDDIKRMSSFFKKVEDKVVGGITWALIAFIGGMLYIFYNHGYFIKK
jgi:hypothetical protein